jgi:hypothetical protein
MEETSSPDVSTLRLLGRNSGLRTTVEPARAPAREEHQERTYDDVGKGTLPHDDEKDLREP